MSFPVQVCLVFVASFGVDVAFTYYVRRTAEGRAVSAALWSGAIATLNAFNVVAYVTDWRLTIPVVLGYMLGTLVAVSWDHKHKESVDALH